MGSFVRRGAHRALVGLLALALAGVATLAPPSARAAADGHDGDPDQGDLGHRGPSFVGVDNPPTADKPQSKLWFHDGAWWSMLWQPDADAWHIHRLDRDRQVWQDTGVPGDDRSQSLSDTLWDGEKLYVASHWVTTSSSSAPRPSVPGRPALLFRYSYDVAGGRFVLDPGYPATITDGSSESLSIEKDSNDRLWATWTTVTGSPGAGYTSTVLISSSSTGAQWTEPDPLPVAGAEGSADDISAVVAFRGGRLGVMWSNQEDQATYFAWRRDDGSLERWGRTTAVEGPGLADDHVSIKSLQSDEQGRVYAVLKTSADELPDATPATPQVLLATFRPAAGTWSTSTVSTVGDCHTRPQLVLDQEHARVHVFATAPVAAGCAYSGAPGAIYHKSAPMADPVFADGRGTPVIRDASSHRINNVTATKQPVTGATGLVVLASDTSTRRYWHADLDLGEDEPEPDPSVRRVGTSTVSTGPAPELSVDTPSQARPGDVLVACLTLNGGHMPTAGIPEGWSKFTSATGAGNPKVYGFLRVAEPGDPDRHTWSFPRDLAASIGVAAYAGTDGLDTPAATAHGPSTTTALVPGVTTETDGALPISCAAINSGSDAITIDPPGDTTRVWSLGHKRQAYAEHPTTDAGPIAPGTWTFSKPRAWAAWTTALRPA